MNKLYSKIKEFGKFTLIGLSVVASCVNQPYHKISISELVQNPKQHKNERVVVEGIPYAVDNATAVIKDTSGKSLIIQQNRGERFDYGHGNFPTKSLSRKIQEGSNESINVFGTFNGQLTVQASFIQIGDTMFPCYRL